MSQGGHSDIANLGATGTHGTNYDINRRFISFDFPSHPSVSDNGGNDPSLVPEDNNDMSVTNNFVDLIIEQEH